MGNFFHVYRHSNLLFAIFALSGSTQAAPVNELQPHFQVKYTIDQSRSQVQVNIPSNRWYIARMVQIWSTLVGYEELAGALSQSETVKYFELIINQSPIQTRQQHYKKWSPLGGNMV